MRPAWTDRIQEGFLPHDTRVRLMRTIECDAAPVHELVAGPRGSHPHRVVIVKHPDPAFRNSAWAIVEPHRDAFVGDVVRLDL